MADRVDGEGKRLLDMGDKTFAEVVFAVRSPKFNLAAGARVAVGASSTAAAALPTLGSSRELFLNPSVRCWVVFGALDVAAAAAAAGNLPLEPGCMFTVTIPADATHFRVIRDSTDGFLTMIPVS